MRIIACRSRRADPAWCFCGVVLGPAV